MSKLNPIETLRVVIDHVRKGQMKHIGFYSNEEIARALEDVTATIRNQALDDVAKIARLDAGGEYADPGASEWLRGFKAGCRHVADKVDSLKSN